MYAAGSTLPENVILLARRGIVRNSYAKLLSRFKGKSTKNKGR